MKPPQSPLTLRLLRRAQVFHIHHARSYGSPRKPAMSATSAIQKPLASLPLRNPEQSAPFTLAPNLYQHQTANVSPRGLPAEHPFRRPSLSWRQCLATFLGLPSIPEIYEAAGNYSRTSWPIRPRPRTVKPVQVLSSVPGRRLPISETDDWRAWPGATDWIKSQAIGRCLATTPPTGRFDYPVPEIDRYARHGQHDHAHPSYSRRARWSSPAFQIDRCSTRIR